jgi:hypothetical protein
MHTIQVDRPGVLTRRTTINCPREGQADCLLLAPSPFTGSISLNLAYIQAAAIPPTRASTLGQDRSQHPPSAADPVNRPKLSICTLLETCTYAHPTTMIVTFSTGRAASISEIFFSFKNMCCTFCIKVENECVPSVDRSTRRTTSSFKLGALRPFRSAKNAVWISQGCHRHFLKKKKTPSSMFTASPDSSAITSIHWFIRRREQRARTAGSLLPCRGSTR